MTTNLLYSNLNRDQIVLRLLEIAKQKLLVKRVVNKYRNSPFYSTIFNQDEVESELYNTVFSVYNALEKYNKNITLVNKRKSLETKLTGSEFSKLGAKLTPSLKTKICRLLKIKSTDIETELRLIMNATTGDLKLDTEAHITGYLIVAFTNNIRKIYGKHQTDKRGFTQMVYLDSHNGESEDSSMIRNKMDSVGSVEPIKEREYNNVIVNMAVFLRNFDKKQNQINQNQKSQLAKLFCSIVNPKKVEDNDELRNRFGWSQYLLNKNKEVMMKKLAEEFSDCQEEIIGYLDSRENFRRSA